MLCPDTRVLVRGQTGGEFLSKTLEARTVSYAKNSAILRPVVKFISLLPCY